MRILRYVAIAIALATVAFFIFFPAWFEKRTDPILHPPPYPGSARARELQRRIPIADLHADSLLWGRDLLKRSDRGHVDVPRLVDANVALQVFSAVTKVPKGLNLNRNDDRSDVITSLALADLWPIGTWNSLTERALYQAHRLEGMAQRSDGRLTLIRTAADLNSYLERRKQNPAITAGLLSIEGAQALDGDLANLDRLFAAGYRMISPTHFFDTDLSGSSAGVVKGGLTEKGREMIRRMEAKHMLVDVAHASPSTVSDVIAMATRPVIVSHTGVRAVCDNNRNLSDNQIRAVAGTGGLIGVGYLSFMVCGTDAAAIARAIKHTSDVAGVDHVALGSDFDGGLVAPFDTTGIVEIVDALLSAGFDEASVAKIMGGNALRVFAQTLP